MKKLIAAIGLAVAIVIGFAAPANAHGSRFVSVSFGHSFPVYSVRAYTFTQPFALQTHTTALAYPTVLQAAPMYNATLSFCPAVAVQLAPVTAASTTSANTVTSATTVAAAPVVATTATVVPAVSVAHPVLSTVTRFRVHDDVVNVNVNANRFVRRDVVNVSVDANRFVRDNVNVAVSSPGRGNNDVNVNVRSRPGLFGRNVTRVNVR